MNVKQMIDRYLADKQNAWELTTLKSERHRLEAVAACLDGKPASLLAATSSMKPYSALTTWTRVGAFWDFCVAMGEAPSNPYKLFKSQNKRLFKNAYRPKLVKMSLEEAKERISRIPDESIRARALLILSGGLRFAESATLQDGQVLGKGAVYRDVYCEAPTSDVFSGPYHVFHYALKKVGLKPHDLRKIAASLLATELNEFELMEAMGWKDINTAKSYVAPHKENIANAFKRLHGGAPNERKQIHFKVSKAS